mgnify:CR=1 FL=1
MSRVRYKAVSLFSGAGGLDLGFVLSGRYDILLANDILPHAVETYSCNFKVKKAVKQYRSSDLPAVVLGDVAELDFSPLEDYEVDVVIGGPPCQDFSIVRGPSTERRGIEVRRGRLYAHFVRALISLRPKAFVFENVPGLKSANKGLAYKVILEDFRKLALRWNEVRRVIGGNSVRLNALGYEIIFSDIIDMSKLGVPQARHRLIIVGIRRDLVENLIKSFDLYRVQELFKCSLKASDIVSKYPLTPLEVFEGKPLPELQDRYAEVMKEYEGVWNKVKTLRAIKWRDEVWKRLTFDVVKDYLKANGILSWSDKELEEAFKEHERLLMEMGYYGVRVSDLKLPDDSNSIPKEAQSVVERMKRIPPDENHEFVRGTPWEVEGRGISLIYRRLHPLKPAYTIVAYGGGGTWGYHYERSRSMLTNRERARLQTFPDSFLFKGTWSQVRAQIGEAVPPHAAKRMAQVLAMVLDELID